MAQPSSPCSRAPIPKHAFSQLLFRTRPRRRIWILPRSAIFTARWRTTGGSVRHGVPRTAQRYVARASRATRLAAPGQCSNGSFDASLRRDRCRRTPPGVPTFAEGPLRIVHAAATPRISSAFFASRTTRRAHQLVDELLPELFRICGWEVRQRRPSTTMKAVFGGWHDGSRTRLLRHSGQMNDQVCRRACVVIRD